MEGLMAVQDLVHSAARAVSQIRDRETQLEMRTFFEELLNEMHQLEQEIAKLKAKDGAA
jgi:hypothetical protein